MFLLPALLARVCLGSARVDSIKLDPAMIRLHDWDALITKDEDNLKEFCTEFGVSLDAARAAGKNIWCHDFLKLLHEKHTTAYRHIADIKESLSRKIFVGLDEFISHSDDKYVASSVSFMLSQLKGRLPYSAAKHYDKPAAELLYPGGSQDLLNASKTSTILIENHTYDLRVRALCLTLMMENMGRLVDRIDKSTAFLCDMLQVIAPTKVSSEMISDKCSSILQMVGASVYMNFAQCFADSVSELCFDIFSELSTAVNSKDEARINVLSSLVAQVRRFVFACLDVSVKDLEFRAEIIRKLSIIISSLEAGHPPVENPPTHQ
ncbi:hypothetical protein PAPHI01_1361 [Pancytospora philotis]|nr:hypothetical protein PAPHI01_1361 [Pancytospora philotis]